MAQPPVQVPTTQPNAGSLTLLEIKLVSSGVAFTPVSVTTGAIAAIGATTLTVTALSGAIPAGTVLHFATGDVVLTAAAAAAATTLTVLPLEKALASGATASYDGFITMPLMGGIALTPTPTDASYAAYVSSGSDVWDYSVKTAMNAGLAFKTAAPDNDPTVAPFVQAGLASGSAALVLFRVRRSSGSWYSGMAHIGVGLGDPERGIAETMFTGKVSGKLTFTP